MVELNVEICGKNEMPSPDDFYPNSTEMPDAAGIDHVIRFSVKDYGQGIEKADMKKIFEPFRQASIETERVHGGTGLGLA